MDVVGFEVEARTATADDLEGEAGRWYADRFGVVPHVIVLVTDYDRVLADLEDKDDAPRAIVATQGGRMACVTSPAGEVLEIVEVPSPAENEASIHEFVTGAGELDGPPVDAITEKVAGIVADACRSIEATLEGVPPDKVLASFLLASQQARGLAPDSAEYWQRSAASTLLSGFVGRSSPE